MTFVADQAPQLVSSLKERSQGESQRHSGHRIYVGTMRESFLQDSSECCFRKVKSESTNRIHENTFTQSIWRNRFYSEDSQAEKNSRKILVSCLFLDSSSSSGTLLSVIFRESELHTFRKTSIYSVSLHKPLSNKFDIWRVRFRAIWAKCKHMG